MKAVVFLGERELRLMDFPDPTPAPDEAVVAIRASGMCGTDLHHYRGPKRSEHQWVIEGHEPCGVVVAIGSAVRAETVRIGDRVIVHHYDGCRTCRHCRSGWTQLCSGPGKVTFGGLDGHGSHAPYMKVPAHTLVKMPEQLSFMSGAALACGTGTAYAAIQRIGLTGDETVAIFGQGPVGLSCTLFAKSVGARVIALDIGEERLAMARRMGADVVINPLKDEPVAAIRDLTRRREGADKTLECSANPGARRQAVEALRKGGTACLLGVYGTIEIDVGHLIQQQKTLLGSITFSKNLLDDCAHHVTERQLDIESLFTHQFRLEQADEAYRMFDAQSIGKGVFLFD